MLSGQCAGLAKDAALSTTKLGLWLVILTVEANPWPMSDGGMPRNTGGMRQRLLDNAAFLHCTQNKFYARKAVA